MSMGIFEKYDYKTWHKNVGYPCIAIQDPGEFDSEYTGRNPQEFFDVFDIKYFQHCNVLIINGVGSWIDLGTIAKLNGKLPSFDMTINFK